MDKNYYISKLNLHQRIDNGFLYGEYPSNIMIPKKALPNSGNRSLFSFAYYLLPYPNYTPFHKLRNYESYQYCDGAPMQLHLISPEGKYESCILGKDLEKGEKFIHIIPPDYWQAAEVLKDNPKNNYSLITHFVSPAFHHDDHEKGDFDKLIQLFPHLEKNIKDFCWNEERITHEK